MSKIPRNMQDKNKFQEVFEDNPELKQILFFGFYVIFFIFIVVLLRSAFSTSNSKTTKYNSGYNYSFNLKSLENNNYHFTYKVTKNGVVTIFDGNKNKNMQEFEMSGNPAISYKSDEDKYYSRNINTLEYDDASNPMEFSKMLLYSNLEKLFIHGSYISKTDYMDESEADYKYEISTNTILRIIDNIEADLDDATNTVIAKVNKEAELYEIDIDLSSYYNYYDNNIKEYKLELNYSKYGEIGELK